MSEKIIKIISVLFALIWGIVIFTEYWHYNPNYAKAVQLFQYTDLLIVFILIGAGLSWFISKPRKTPLKLINGFSLFGFILFLDAITVSFFYGKIESLSLNTAGLMAHLGLFAGVAFCIYLIYLVSRVLGFSFTTVFPIKVSLSDLPIIQVALGTAILTFLLFFLGILGVLNVFIVAPLLILVLAVNWRATIDIIKKSLFKPLNIEGLNTLGIFCFLFLSLFLIFDFAQILRPFPAGTDSINLYVNLPKLINDYSGLVAGNQPYNWSLFMSLGLVVFGRIDVVLGLSFLGSFLALIALFRLSQKWLDINYSALCLLLFFSVPMVNFLAYMDMKIDMALLFISLSVLLLFYNWLVPPTTSSTIKKVEKKNSEKKGKGMKSKQLKKILHSSSPFYLVKTKAFFAKNIPSVFVQNRLLILMGLLSGFGFGIKLTFVFFFFALVTAVWFAEGGLLTFLSAFFLTLGTTFLLELDAHPLLRSFHESVDVLQWILLAVGLVMAAFLFFKEKAIMIKLVRSSLILSLFFLLPIVPWFGKNYAETESFSVEDLLNGKEATPVLDFKGLKKKLKQGK